MSSDVATSDSWKALSWFFGLSFAIAWSIWLAIGLAMPDLKSSVGTFITVPGAWAPTLSALVLTAKFEGRGAVRDLLRQVVHWRFRWWWYVIAILAPTALALVSVGVVVALGEPAPTLETITSGLGMPAELSALLVGFPIVFMLLIFGGPLGEELGWRGFAQNRLQRHLPPGQAGILIGIVWAVWHLPLIVVVPSGTGEIPSWFFFPFTVALGVIFAWGYNRTGRSALFAVLLHAGINTMSGYQLLTADDNNNRLITALLLVVLLAGAAYRSLARDATGDRGLRTG